MSSHKIALIAGATGLVGRNLVHELCQSKTYHRMYVLARQSISYPDRRVHVLVVNYEDLISAKQAVPGFSAHHYYCCLGARAGKRRALLRVDYDYVLYLAKLAEKDKICTQFVLLSSIGAHLHSPFYYTFVKGKIEHALRSLSIKGLHILRPSGILGPRLHPRMTDVGILITYKIVTMLLLGKKAYLIAMPATYVAKAMYRLAAEERAGHSVYSVQQLVSLARRD